MNARVITDIRKEAISARSENLDDETKPIPGRQFAPWRRRSPDGTAPRRTRAIPRVGRPPPWDFAASFVSASRNERPIGPRGIWRVGCFRLTGQYRRPTYAFAARCDCNLRSSRAQFDKGANRVFYKQIDAI
jgi:hypothetical protein